MSSKQSNFDLTKWSIIFVFLWTLNSSWVTALSTQGSITQTKVDVETEAIYLAQITKGTINEKLGFFDKIAKQPLKIILVIGLSLALLMISIVIIRKCYQCYHSLSAENQAYAMVIRIGKSQHMF